MTPDDERVAYQTLKRESRLLRGDIALELDDLSLPDVSDAAARLLAFHGVRQTSLRDFSFTVRLKCPAGRLTAEQYLVLDECCDRYGNGSMRICPDQTIELEGVEKQNLRPLIAEINQALLSTFGAFGDVVNAVRCCPAPIKDEIHFKLEDVAYLLAKHVTPKTKAYYELWLGGEKIEAYPFNAELDIGEPLYGQSYLDRGLTIAVARPEDNCVDALAADIAVLPLFEGETCVGYNLATNGKLVTFVDEDALLASVDALIKCARDGAMPDFPASPPKPMPAFTACDHSGWGEQKDGRWFLGLPIAGGRIADQGRAQYRAGLRAIIAENKMNVMLSACQHVILCDIEDAERFYLGEKLRRFGIPLAEEIPPIERYAIVAAGPPYDDAALAEAERIAQPLLQEIGQVLERYDLEHEHVSVRIAGGPESDARPLAGDIGIIGVDSGHYDLYVSGELYAKRVPLELIADRLAPLIASRAEARKESA